MAEGFICRKKSKNNLGELDLFVNGLGEGNWDASGLHTAFGETLKASVSSYEQGISAFQTKNKNINFDNIDAVQFITNYRQERSSEGPFMYLTAYVEIYENGNSATPVAQEVVPFQKSVIELDTRNLTSDNGYYILIKNTGVESNNFSSVLDVSRVSFIPTYKE